MAMTYQGYDAAFEFDAAAGVFHGEIVNLRDVVTFRGASIAELGTAFGESVEDYLAFCQARSENPGVAG